MMMTFSRLEISNDRKEDDNVIESKLGKNEKNDSNDIFENDVDVTLKFETWS